MKVIVKLVNGDVLATPEFSEDIPDVDVERMEEALRDYSAMDFFSIENEDGKHFINPANILWVRLDLES